MSETKTLHVTGMTCGGCENTVKRALSQLPGVASVSASHLEAEVSVTFDTSQVTLDRLRERIEMLGYHVQ